MTRSKSQLIVSRDVWRTVTPRLKKDKGRIVAAVAYLGTNGSDLLPLKPGDTLVVDMSLKTVAQGATNPAEVAKFMRRKVDVFSRLRAARQAHRWLELGRQRFDERVSQFSRSSRGGPPKFPAFASEKRTPARARAAASTSAADVWLSGALSWDAATPESNEANRQLELATESAERVRASNSAAAVPPRGTRTLHRRHRRARRGSTDLLGPLQTRGPASHRHPHEVEGPQVRAGRRRSHPPVLVTEDRPPAERGSGPVNVGPLV